jgi:hypothetical protein
MSIKLIEFRLPFRITRIREELNLSLSRTRHSVYEQPSYQPTMLIQHAGAASDELTFLEGACFQKLN